MPQRETLIWGGILTGICLMMWMAHVLMATERETELILVLCLGGASLSLLSRQARRAEVKLAMYLGFTAASFCFGLAVLTGLNILAVGQSL